METYYNGYRLVASSEGCYAERVLDGKLVIDAQLEEVASTVREAIRWMKGRVDEICEESLQVAYTNYASSISREP